MLMTGTNGNSEMKDFHEMFVQADTLLFKESKYEQAEKIYKAILSQ